MPLSLDVVAIALFSGLFAGLSPCALAVYPIMLDSLVKSAGENGGERRLVVLSFTLGIVLMFVLFYVVIGVLVGFYGGEFTDNISSYTKYAYFTAAVLSFLFALQNLTGAFHIFGETVQFLRVPESVNQQRGVVGAFIKGVVFASIVNPCNAPFLITGIVPLISAGKTIISGILLATVFALSMGAPMLLFGIFAGEAVDLVRGKKRLLEIASGFFLMLASAYFASNGLRMT